MKARPVVYIKTHKTGSTLIRAIVEAYADRHGLRKLLPPPEQQSNFVCNMSPVYLAGLEGPFGVSARHIAYDADFFRRLVPDALYLSSVREPLNRAISHYYYLHPDRNRPDFPDFNTWYAAGGSDPPERCPTWEQVHAGFDDYMCRWMGIDGPITVESVRQRYDLICIQEYMPLSLERLSDLLGTDVWNTRMRRNNTERYRRFRISEEIAQLFRDRNRRDYRLYEICCELLLAADG